MEESSTLDIKDASNELLPPEGSESVGREVFKIFEKILEYKADQGLPDKWHRCYELAKGKHWRQETKKASLVTANLLYAHRSRTVAMLTDNNPTFNTRAAGEVPAGGGMDLDMLQHTASHWWNETEQQDVLETSVINGETNGICIEKVRFDPNEEYGRGEVVTDQVDPYYFGWFPCDQMNPQKADANLHYWPMNIREARRRWPDFAGQILPDKDWIDQIGDLRSDVQTPMSKDRGGFISRIAGAIKTMTNNAEQTIGKDDNVLIIEAWVKDYTRVTNPDGSTQDLYPGNIRCVWTCNGGEIVLQDEKNVSINWEAVQPEVAAETFLFDKFPFNVTVSVKDTASPWGQTDMEQLESLNMEFNKTISQLTLMKDKASHINIINPKNTGVANSKFTNSYGVISPKNHVVAESIRYMDQPKVPPEINVILQTYRELFFLVSGAFDLEQADSPASNVIAYKAIAALLERVATLLRGKLRNYNKLIRYRGRMYISCAQNWYVEDRWISYEVDGEEEVKQIKGSQLMLPGKLSVVSGSTMPVSKIQQREEAIELAKMGIIDNEELLKKLEWNDRKSVIERMKRGPVGIAMDRLAELGLPPEVAEYFINVGVMDEKDFEKAVENGELPPIYEVLFPPAEGVGAEKPNPVDDAEVAVKAAQVDKLEAETQLILEKIRTEQAQQEVLIAGTDFDREKLAIERARTVSDIQAKRTSDARENVKTVVDLERGEKAEQRSDKAEQRANKGELREDARLAIRAGNQRGRAEGPRPLS